MVINGLEGFWVCGRGIYKCIFSLELWNYEKSKEEVFFWNLKNLVEI